MSQMPKLEDVALCGYGVRESSEWQHGRDKLDRWHAHYRARRERAEAARRKRENAETLAWAKARAERMAKADFVFDCKLHFAKIDLEKIAAEAEKKSADGKANGAKGAAVTNAKRRGRPRKAEVAE